MLYRSYPAIQGSPKILCQNTEFFHVFMYLGGEVKSIKLYS